MIGDPGLTRRAVVYAKIETVPGVDAAPGASDAILVSNPDTVPTITMLARDFSRQSLSPLTQRAGRHLGGLNFAVELKSNGLTNSGSINDAPRIGRLLRACGFSEEAISGSGRLGAVRAVGTHPVSVSWAGGGSITATLYHDYLVTVVLGGASATAKVRVTDTNGMDTDCLQEESFRYRKVSASGTIAVNAADPLSVTFTLGGTWAVGDYIALCIGGEWVEYVVPSGGTAITAILDDLQALVDALTDIACSDDDTDTLTVTFSNDKGGTTVTSGSTAVALGSSGATITPTWSGNLTIGKQWRVRVSPAGIKYEPVSDDMETVTLYCFYEGLLHKLTGAMGTVSASAEGGNYGTLTFNFTGNWIEPTDAEIPEDAVFEALELQPPVFELARVRIGAYSPAVRTWTFAMNNVVNPREDANYASGYNGVRISARTPSGGMDPESRPVGEYALWSKLKNSEEMQISTRFGTEAGNTVWFKAPAGQYTGAPYRDRNGIRTHDVGIAYGAELAFADDECHFFFS